RLRAAGVLSATRAADLGEAMDHLLGLRARAQAAALRAGAVADDRVRPDDLSGLEREQLKQCFKVVADFQDMLRRRYSLHLMT
ncbi:cyclic nucleotide-binding protein, partial [Desulfovibrio sp. DS-1]